MVPLAQFVQLNPRPPKGLNDSQEVSFLSMASISEDGVIVHQETRLLSDVKRGFTYFQRGDVLLAKITPCFENGKSAPTESLEHEIGFGSTEFHVFRAIPERLDSRFLFHLVRSSRLRFLGKKSMKGAAGHKRVPADFLEKFEIPAWPLHDQIRIAHLLGKVEGLIAQRKQHLQQLDDLLKSVFLEMFGDPIVNPRGFPIRRLSDFYVNPKEGTKCGPFGSALKKEELVESGIPVWNMDNIGPAGQMALPFRMWITSDKYAELAAYSVQDGDIVISRAGTVGKMCVVRMQVQPAIISTNLIRLRLGPELSPLHFVSLMLYCKGRVGRLKTGPDGAFTHMNTGVLDSLEFPYPPIELQNQFAEVAHKVEEIKSSYQQSLTDLEALYGTLSQKAFKGELDLSRVPLPSDQAPQADPAPLPEEIVTPTEVLNSVVQFAPLESRSELLARWFNHYLANTSPDVRLGSREFLEAGWQTLQETRLESEGESPALTLADYDALKDLIFAALEGGTLVQTFAEVSNRVSLHRRPADWGTF